MPVQPGTGLGGLARAFTGRVLNKYFEGPCRPRSPPQEDASRLVRSSPVLVSTGSSKVTLIGNGAFADDIQMRAPWLRLGPEPGDLCPHRKRRDPQTRERTHGDRRQTGVMPPQAREHLEPPGAGRGGKEPRPALLTPTPDFWPPDREQISGISAQRVGLVMAAPGHPPVPPPGVSALSAVRQGDPHPHGGTLLREQSDSGQRPARGRGGGA